MSTRGTRGQRKREKRRKLMLKRLRQAREEAQYTQERAAQALGMKHASFISKVESGERRLDALELQDLAAIYGKPLEFFIPGD